MSSFKADVYKFLSDHPGQRFRTEDIAAAMNWEHKRAHNALYQAKRDSNGEIQTPMQGIYMFKPTTSSQMFELVVRQGDLLVLRDENGKILVCTVKTEVTE